MNMYNFSLFKNKLRALIFIIVVWIFSIGVFFVMEKKTKLSEGIISSSINQSSFQNHQAIQSKNSQNHLSIHNPPIFVKTHKLPENITFVSFLHDKEGNSWGGTNCFGLWEQAKNSQFFIQNKKFPTGDSVLAIFEDLKHNLWVGDQKTGVYEKKTGEDDFHSFKFDMNACFITQDKTGNLWVGTINSGLWEKKVGSTSFKNNGTFGLDWSWYTADIYFKDNSGNLWAGISDNSNGNGPFPPMGVGLWEKKGEKKGFQIESIPHNAYIRNMLQDQGGKMYVGLNYSRPEVSGLFERQTENDKFSLDSSFNGNCPHFRPKSIFEDKDDNLWIQSEGDLWEKRATENKFKKNTIFSKTPLATLTTHLFQDTLGNLWIGKWGSGLWEKQAGKNKKFEINKSFPSMFIVNICQKNDDSMFIDTVKNGWWSNSAFNKGFTVSSSSDKTNGYYCLDRYKKYVVVFNGGFDIKINSSSQSSIIKKMIINNHEVNSNEGNIIHFPNASKTDWGKPIEVFVTYKDGSNGTWSYLIKGQYSDDGSGGNSSVTSALTSRGGKEIVESYPQLTGDSKHVKYHLFSTLAVKNKKTNPNLTMENEKFNFLTDFVNSSYVKININNGIISKIPTTKKSLEGYNGFCTITGSSSNNLYEVDLVDHVGNKQSFLIQVGGLKLNHNFISTSHTWEYLVIGLGALVVFLVLCGITYRWIYYPRKRWSTLFGIRNSNKIKTINIKKIRNLELKTKAKKRKQTKKK